jgi:excinuclease ABC subunit A
MIKIRGAREHNLKNIDIDIPKNKLVVVTGVSGSGKSTLAFDTIYAEGQRRYVESLSSYARQFLELMEKPDVDSIEGLSPSIAIEQKTVSKNPRSTVGTITEIYDYLRVLFANLGEAFCYKCGKKITSQTSIQILEELLKLPFQTRIIIYSPVIRGRKGEFQKEFKKFLKDGFTRVKVDGELYSLEDDNINLNKNQKHNVDVLIDRVIIKEGVENRLIDSVETALNLSNGLVKVELFDKKEEIIFSEKAACIDCGISYPEISPRLFSFNNPYGACDRCRGLGFIYGVDEDEAKNNDVNINRLRSVVEDYNAGYFPMHKKFKIKNIIKKYSIEIECPDCKGSRLKREAQFIKFKDYNIYQLTEMSVEKLKEFFSGLQLTEEEVKIGRRLFKEINNRLEFLTNVGLNYLTLNRRASTLSGGESQRIRLATQIGSGLSGVIYVLDEPSIGLHQRDNIKLLETLKKLRDTGNTLIVVEHDEETIRKADFIVDLGVGAGVKGGNVVAKGTLKDIIQCKDSLTGRYLSKQLEIPIPEKRKKSKKFLEITGASENNLKNVNVKIPLNVFTCITGVSGSGKSTLLLDILYNGLKKLIYNQNVKHGKYKELKGWNYIDKVIKIDQSPIGRTPRSNPATYTGVFTNIRDIFAKVPQSKMRGFKPGRFSFNVKGGRCEHCSGDGVIKLEMLFLPDVYIKCEVCQGKRYNKDTLNIKFKGKNIADVLDMTVNQAYDFFINIPSIKNKLEILKRVGLGYIKLGQSATTLSGGEAQRIKLAKELSKRDTGNTLYILDEPTTGLHFDDISKLLSVLFELRDRGNTIILIEHNLDVIKCADYIIDLGPEGGDKGGYVIATGTPEEVAKNPKSYTGEFLKKIIGNSFQ